MYRKIANLSVVSLLMLLSVACSDDKEMPRVDGVWFNMVSRPIEQTTCAYPGQTLCVRGSGLGGLRKLTVNGTVINLNNILVYASDNSITFQVPADVKTTGDNIHVVTTNGKVDYPFIIRTAAEQPTLSYDSNSSSVVPFSSLTLVPGNTLEIKGSNLEGVKEVWLPLAFGDRIQCELDPETASTDEKIFVKIPETAHFASGRCEVVMEKYDAVRDITYIDKLYSKVHDFKN